MVSENRFAALPKVPTTMELGYKADVVAWRGLVAPKDTPQPVADCLIEAIKKTTKDPDFLKFMDSKGISITLVTGTPSASGWRTRMAITPNCANWPGWPNSIGLRLS